MPERCLTSILSPDLIDDLIKMGKIAVNTRTDLGRHAMGVGMHKGASKPDISSAVALKDTMLNARSVAYFREGTLATASLTVAVNDASMPVTSALRMISGGPTHTTCQE